MAHDQQTHTQQAEFIQLDGGGQGILPYSKAVHRGNLGLDGSGAGDTASCRVTLPLPSNTVWLLDHWSAAVYYNTNPTTPYAVGNFEMYYAPSTTEFGQSTQINFPIAFSAKYDITGVTRYQGLGLGQSAKCLVASATNSDVAIRTGDPYKILSFNDESGGADPVIDISGNSSQAIAQDGSLLFAVGWLGFTFEQINRAELWAGFNSR